MNDLFDEDRKKNIQKAKRILGKDSDNYTDKELLEMHETAKLFADILIDMYLKMTPEQRKKWHEDRPTAIE